MRADAEKKRSDLLQAAWRLFAQQGPDVSLRAVAAEANVGIATLYRHFPAKDDLILGLHEEIGDRIEKIVERHATDWDTDPHRTWNSLVHDIAALEVGALAYRMAPLAERSPHLVDALESRRSVTVAALDDALDRAKAAHLVAEDVDTLRFFSGLAAITRPLPPHVEAALPGQRAWLVDTYIAGLGAGGRTWK